MKHNIMRTDFRNFLTQRSLQSFIHLCIECRDPHTVKWLEDFGGWENLENFHGTGALNVTKFPSWSSILMDMMKQPEDVVIVSAKRRGAGHGGWSKNNPFLEVSELFILSSSSRPSSCSEMRKARSHGQDPFCHGHWMVCLSTPSLRLNHLPIITILEIPIQYIFYVIIPRLDRARFFTAAT